MKPIVFREHGHEYEYEHEYEHEHECGVGGVPGLKFLLPCLLMPVHNFEPPKGELRFLEIDSKALRGNLLGDPSKRVVAAYRSPGPDQGPRPLIVYLASFTGSGLKKLSWQMFGESVPQRIDRLVGDGRLGPVVVAFPDGFTSLGGNQYINSKAMGRWEDFLLHETLPELEARFPILEGPSGRAILGFSSGGYGAMVQALRHGDQWAAVACHSGDMGFELSLLGEFPATATALDRFEGDVAAFIRHFEESPKVQGDDLHALMILAMAASYDPDPAAFKGIRLPFDPRTCELRPERWRRWLEWDPLRMVERRECQESLRKLKGLYFDCGRRDQYHLQYGARRFAARLQALNIGHRHEEFDDNHSGVEYRLDESLPYLYRILSG